MFAKKSNSTAGATRSIAVLGLILGLVAVAVLVVSYIFHTTTIDVYALSTDEVNAAFENDVAPRVTVEFYDDPVGGVVTGVLEIDESQIELDDQVIRVSTQERTRKLPQGAYLQLCVDGEDDGHNECLGTAEVDETVNDMVSCTRVAYQGERSWLSADIPAYMDVRCTSVTSPFTLALTADTSVLLDNEPLTLLEGDVADLTALINQHLIEHDDLVAADHEHADDHELSIDSGELSVVGPGHEDNQQLELVGTELTIANGNTIDLSSALPSAVPSVDSDDQIIDASLSGTELTIVLEDGGSAVIDLSSLTQDEDDQLLNLSGNELTLSNGTDADSVVDLGPFLDDTDSFRAVQCPGTDQQILAFTTDVWSCIDPTDAETLTTIGYNAANQTIDYVDEDGVITSLPITTLETTTLVTDTLAVGNIIGRYTNEDGSSVDLVETVSMLFDNGDQTFTYVNEAGTASLIDITQMETLSTVINTIAGNPIGTYVDEDGNQTVLNETISELAANADGSITFTGEDGLPTTLSIGDLETLSSVTNVLAAGNRIGSYTDEDGTSIDLRETVTSLADNNDGTFTFTHEGGSTTTLDIRNLETLTAMSNLLSAGNLIGTYTDEDGGTFDLLESVTGLASDGQSLVFTDESGVDTSISMTDLETLTSVTQVLTDGHLIGVYIDEDGQLTELMETVTGLASDGQNVVFTDENGDDTTISLSDLETLTSVTQVLTDGHLIGVYIDEDGQPTDLLETVTGLRRDGQNLVFSDENGDETSISMTDLETLTSVTQVLTDGHLIGVYVDEDGQPTDLLETVTELTNAGQDLVFTDENGMDTAISMTDLETLTSVTQVLTEGHLIGVYVDEDGQPTNLLETVTELTNNGQDLVFTDENGVDTTISMTDLETLTSVTQVLTDGHLIGVYVDEDGQPTDLLETVTELTNNGQDLVFTDENGVDTTISMTDLETLTSVTQVLTDGHLIGVYIDEDGQPTDLLETVTELTNDGQDLVFTDENGVDTTISMTDLETLTSVTQVLTAGHLIGVYNDEDGQPTNLLETVTELTSVGQSVVFTDENGAETAISMTDLETLTSVTQVLTAGHLIGVYIDEDGQPTDLLETVTELTNSGQDLVFTDENGVDTTISMTDLETLTSVTQVLTDGHLIGVYNDEDGQPTNLLETVTELTNNGQDLVFTDENGDETSISMTDLETLTSVTQVLTDGHLIGVYNDEDGQPTNLLETVTELTNTGQNLVFTDENGVDTSISMTDLETLTSVTQVLTDGHLIGVYTDEDGQPTNLLETVTELTNTGQNLVFTDENGVDTTISMTDLETLTSVTQVLTDGHLIGVYIDEDGQPTDLLETVTVLTNDGQDLVFTDENGVDTTISMTDLETLTSVTQVLTDGHLIGVYNDEDGQPTDLLETVTELTNNGQDLVFTDENGVDTSISMTDLETLTSITQVLTDGHLIGVYNDEDGQPTNLLETVTELTNNGQNLIFTDENGDDTTISMTDLETLTSVTQVLTDGHLIGVYNDEDGQPTNLLETVTELTNTGQDLVFTDENGDDTTISMTDLETLTSVTQVLTDGHLIGVYNDEDGQPTNLLETVTELTNNGQDLVFTDENGVDTTISMTDLETLTSVTQVLTDGHLIGVYTDEDGQPTNLLETVTQLTNNGQNLIFTDENGVDTTISMTDLETLTSVTQVLTDGHLIGVYIDEDGQPTNLLETVTELTNNGQDLVFTDENGVDTTISMTDLETLTSVTQVLTDGHLIGVYNDEDGQPTNLLETVTELTNNGQDLVFTDENGVDTTISMTDLETLTSVTQVLTDGHLIGVYNDEDGQPTNLLETVTELTNTGQNLIFTDENGDDTTISMTDLETLTSVTQVLTDGHLIGVYNDEDGQPTNLLETVTELTNTGQDLVFTDENGVDTTISMTDLETLTSVTQVLTDGHLIGVYNDEDGQPTNLLETVTELTNNGQNLVFTDENGVDTTISMTDLETLTSVTQVLTDGHLIGVYNDEDGQPTNLLETVTELTNNGQDLVFTDENGVDTTISMTDLETLTSVTQVLTDGHLIGVYNDEDGQPTNLLETVTELTNNGQDLVFTDENGVDTTISMTDLETLTSVTQVLTDGHLIGVYNDEDGQPTNLLETVTELTNNGQDLVFTDENGDDTTISMTDLETLTSVTQVLTDGHLIGVYNDEDGQPTNLLETVTELTNNGQDLVFTDENGDDTTISVTDLETLTSVTQVLTDGHLIGVYNDEDGQPTNLLETVTELTNNGQDLVFTDENGDDTTISVTDLETLTSVTQVLTDGHLIGVYNDEDGQPTDLLETVTELTNTGQDLVFTDENGVDTTISMTDLETLTSVTQVLTDGHLIGVYNDEDGQSTNLLETVTELTNTGQDLVFTDENGVDTTISMTDLETLTSVTQVLTDGHLIGVYNDEDGQSTNLLETVTELTNTGQDLVFTDENGVDTTISMTDLETLTSVTQVLTDGHLIGVYTDEDGQPTNLLETVTELTNNGQNLIFTDEDGVDTTISMTDLETLTSVTQVLTDGHLIGVYNDEDGQSTNLLETVTELTNTGQNLIFTDENGDDTTISMTDLETLTSVTQVLTDGHLIGVYTDEDGQPTNLLETVTELTNTGQNLVFTDENGDDTTIDVRDLETLTLLTAVLNNGHLIGTYTNEDGVAVNLLETITTLVKNADGSFTYTNEDGITTDFDVTDLETLTSITGVLANGHLIGTYTDEDGQPTNLLETVTSVVAGTDGTFTFTDENGDPTVVSIAQLETLSTITNVLASGHEIGTYTDEDGGTIDLLETVTSLTQSGSIFTFNHEDGSSTDVDIKDLETISTVTNVLAAGHLIGIYTDEDGNSINLRETVTQLVANADQTFTFTHEDGSTSTIDITDLETITQITDVINTGNLIGTYENEAGQLVDIRETITSLAVTGPQEITYTNEVDDDVVVSIADLETITTITGLLANGHLIGEYENEDGMVFDLLETITSTTVSGQVVTFVHEDASTSTIDIAALETLTDIADVLAVGHIIGTYTDEDGGQTELRETITQITANNDGTFTFTHEDASQSTIDISDLETLTTITQTITGNRIATYTNETGAAVDINETITELVANADGTLTYVDEAGVKHEIIIENGNTYPVQTIYEEFYAIGTDDGITVAWNRNMKMQRVSAGIWEVGFATPHPDGTAYAVNVLTQEQANLRDSVMPWIEQGSKTANGFRLHLVTGDNGTAADIYVDTPFTISINAPVKVLVEGP